MALASWGPKRGGGAVHTMTFGGGELEWGWGLLLLIMTELLCLFLFVANSLSFLTIIIYCLSGGAPFFKYLLNDNFAHV